MEGDGSAFSFSTVPEYQKGPDATDISWADIFLEGIHSDEPNIAENGVMTADMSSLAAGVYGNAQHILHQSHPGMLGAAGGHVQFHQLQGSTSGGTITYLAPSPSGHQHIHTSGGTVTLSNHHQMAAPVGQQHNNAKLFQISPSFPMSQQLQGGVPLQTLLHPGQAMTGPTFYTGQGGGMFPTHSSVHIENPKVVNVNFGPHVISSDGGGQQTIIQTAEGKGLLITNSQLQEMQQPLMSTQLINTAEGSVIRTSLPPGSHTIMSSSAAPHRQIVLQPGQTVIHHQNSYNSGVPKNVVLRTLAPNLPPVVYQNSQGGQLLHQQPAYFTSSGSELHVVNTNGGQGALIGQPGLGQQQGTIMNLINNTGVQSAANNQLSGILPNQNIFVNGQVLSFGQLGNVGVPQIQVQRNSQEGAAFTDFGPTSMNQYTSPGHQVLLQRDTQQQQQQVMLPSRSNQHIPLNTNASMPQRYIQNQSAGKFARTPTPTASSASSTPTLTPTPSTPTPSPTTERLSDYPMGTTVDSTNLLKKALDMSEIDLQSYQEETGLTYASPDCFPVISSSGTSPYFLQSAASTSKPVRSKTKNNKTVLNVSVSNASVPYRQMASQLCHQPGQNVAFASQKRLVTSNGPEFVLATNRHHTSLPLSAASSPGAPKFDSTMSPSPFQGQTPSNYMPGSLADTNRTYQYTNQISGINPHLAKYSVSHGLLEPTEQRTYVMSKIERGDYVSVKREPYDTYTSAACSDQKAYYETSPPLTSPNSSDWNQMQTYQQLKGQQTSTLSGTKMRPSPQGMMMMIKQEQLPDLHPPDLNFQSSPSGGLPSGSHSYLATPATCLSAMTSSLVVSSASFTAVVTTTTQAHQSTIMSTSAHLASTPSTSSTSLPVFSSQILPSCPLAPMELYAPTHSKASSKERDPANIKAMIPIKIADTTLMLSLTPGQKERLEQQLARMSQKDQEEFLVHQQNVIRRSQLMQQKQQFEQLKQQQHNLQEEQQSQEFPQQHQHSTEQAEFVGSHKSPAYNSTLRASPLQQARSAPVCQISSPAAGGVQTARDRSPQCPSPPAIQAALSIPSTVQELMETSDEQELRMKLPEKQHRRTPPHHQSQPAEQVLLTRAASLAHPAVAVHGGRCLAEQQLLRDRSLAVDPDVSSPFRSVSDAMRRLIRYHTMQDHKPEEDSKTLRVWDSHYSKLCEYLTKKKRCYMKRFRKIMMHRDMCQDAQPAHIQNLICFNQQMELAAQVEQEESMEQTDLFDPDKEAYYYGNTMAKEKSEGIFSEHTVYSVTNNIQPIFKDSSLLDSMSDSESDSSSDGSEYIPDSGRGLATDGGSSGKLKLVLRRNTPDNFIVKNSVKNVKELPKGFRPVVNLEKSDSEYEFDPPSTANVTCDQAVIVRRRSSHLVSVEATTEPSASEVSDHIKGVHLQSEDVILGKDRHKNSEDNNNLLVEASDGSLLKEPRPLKRKYCVSVEEETDINCDQETIIYRQADHSLEATRTVTTTCQDSASVGYDGSPLSSCRSEMVTNLQGLENASESPPSVVINAAAASSQPPCLSPPYPQLESIPPSSEHGSSESNPEGQHSAQGYDCVDESRGSGSHLEAEGTKEGLACSSLFSIPTKHVLDTESVFHPGDDLDKGRPVDKWQLDAALQNDITSDSVRVNCVQASEVDLSSEGLKVSPLHRRIISSEHHL